MTKPAQVSEEFMSFYQGAASDTVEKAKQAESNLGNIPLPIGTNGQCRVEQFRFGKTPDKLENGVTKSGTNFCEVSVRTIAPEEITGRILKKIFWFSTKNPDSLRNGLETYFSTLVSWGLPEEIRKNHKKPQEIADWFMSNDITLDFAVTSNPNDTMNDGKGLRVYRKSDPLDMSASVTPNFSQTPAPAPQTGGFTAGDKVQYRGETYEYIESYPSGKLGLKSVKTGEDVVATVNEVIKL